MRRRLLLTALATFVLFLLAVAALVATGLHDNPAPADVALVPGNTVLPTGLPSARLEARLQRTAELYHQHLFPKIIVSGGTGKEGFDEARVMAVYLTARGIPPASIIEDRGGATTYDSARFTAAWLPDRQHARVLVISQYFHVPRCALALRRFGIGTVYTAHARFFEGRDLYSIPRELAGCLAYIFRRYPDPVALSHRASP